MGNKVTTICKNCENETQGNYCSNCGQRTTVNKVTFKETFQDLVDAFFSINAPLFTTLKMLIINPGRLFNEYLKGKRKSYYRPVTFFILMTVIYLVIRSIINYDPFGSSLLQVKDPSNSQLLTKARNFMLLNIDKFLFVFAFSLGLMLKIFFYKKKSLAEFLAISFFLMGIYTILTIFNMFNIRFIDNTFQGIHIVLMLLYFIYAMVSFFRDKKLIVILKSLFVYAIAFYFYGFLAFGLSYIIVLIKNS
jgi:hypothetical protein